MSGTRPVSGRTVELGEVLRRAAALQAQGDPAGAAALYRTLVALFPGAGDIVSNLAAVLFEINRLPEAFAGFRRAALLRGAHATPYLGLATVLQAMGRALAACRYYRIAVAIDPTSLGTCFNHGVAWQNAGLPAQAAPCFRQAAALAPNDAAVLSQHLFSLNYLDISGEALLAAHRDFVRLFPPPSVSPPVSPLAPPPAGALPPERLRIGYVSVEFRRHLGANFLAPVLENHDRSAFEVYCYSMLEPGAGDACTRAFKARADGWRDVLGLDDQALAAQIRADRIDVLVDLAGHTMRNRLGVFALKPAPAQFTWLGYANTTGLAAVDYRIVDEFTDPPGRSEAHAAERLLRLPAPFLCFRPHAEAPDVTPLPAGRVGGVTFGSFNTLAKTSDGVFPVWAEILRRVPDSRLLLKDRAFNCPDTAAWVRRRFVEGGVAADRVELIGFVADPAEHLALYGRVDVALDPFPYNGTITTCDALWMGAPVVALRGGRHAARVGASLCSVIGLPELVADTPERYIDVAIGLANDLNRLMRLRVGMRARLTASPLCDERRFVANLETAYRAAWRARRDGAFLTMLP